jgi:predicted transcriptional regulator
MEFDPRYQDGKNGALKKEVRDRLTALREYGLTLADVGKLLDLSGPFVSQLLNEKTPGRVRSTHIPRIVKAIEAAEQSYLQTKSVARVTVVPTLEKSIGDTLAYHMRAIDALGFNVTVSPKQ